MITEVTVVIRFIHHNLELTNLVHLALTATNNTRLCLIGVAKGMTRNTLTSLIGDASDPSEREERRLEIEASASRHGTGAGSGVGSPGSPVGPVVGPTVAPIVGTEVGSGVGQDH